jgi:hypothetical protein
MKICVQSQQKADLLSPLRRVGQGARKLQVIPELLVEIYRAWPRDFVKIPPHGVGRLARILDAV